MSILSRTETSSFVKKLNLSGFRFLNLKSVAFSHKNIIVFLLACVSITKQRRQLTFNAFRISHSGPSHDIRSEKRGTVETSPVLWGYVQHTCLTPLFATCLYLINCRTLRIPEAMLFNLSDQYLAAWKSHLHIPTFQKVPLQFILTHNLLGIVVTPGRRRLFSRLLYL